MRIFLEKSAPIRPISHIRILFFSLPDSLLGAPNDDQGQLLPIARSRCDAAVRQYLQDPTQQLLCTGGFGPGFNRTVTPHAAYAKAHLVTQGVPESMLIHEATRRDTDMEIG